VKPELKKLFIAILRRQKDAYKRLMPVMSEESRVLAGNNVKSLDSVLFKQEGILAEIKKAEDEKQAVYSQILADEGLGEMSLQEYLAKADSENNADLEKEISELIDCVKEIDAANKGNTMMIKNFLTMSDFTAQLKDKLQNPVNVTYNRKAGKDEYKDIKASKGLDIKL